MSTPGGKAGDGVGGGRSDRLSGLDIEMRRCELRFEHFGCRSGKLCHGGAGGCARFVVLLHQRQRFVPDSDQGLAEVRVGLERCSIDHQQVENLTRDICRTEHLKRTRLLLHSQQLRVPGYRSGHVGRGIGRGDIGIGRVDRTNVGHREIARFQCAGEQIMRYRKLDQIDLPPGDIGEPAGILEQHAIIAVRIIANDQRGGVLAARGGDRQGVHVRDSHPVELPSGVLVHRFDVVVDLNDIDFDAVFVRPLLHDPRLFGIGPGHPSGVDRPADGELCLGRCRFFARWRA